MTEPATLEAAVSTCHVGSRTSQVVVEQTIPNMRVLFGWRYSRQIDGLGVSRQVDLTRTGLIERPLPFGAIVRVPAAISLEEL